MNKMAEKNDQKMRERAERAEKFQAKLQELLARVKHAASVHPEPGSNSHKKFFPFQNQLAN